MRGREMAQGTIAGRYRMLREVGRGGMGSVWLCQDERLGRQVAVKRVGHVNGEAPDVARAMREARSSAPLNHPGVVAIYDAIDEGDQIWLVMEYVDGRTLAQVIASDGPVPPERAAEIGAQVADGLAAAHARGTIHRDIKPSNILLGPDGRAKISDFGIARTMGDEALTQTGFVSGTPNYLSPEIARGEDPSPASDVWALGATLFAAVEGRPPYASQPNPLATLAAIVSKPPPRPERAGALSEPIRRMMDPDPQSRWDVADGAHALRRIHARHRTDRTREETAAFGRVAAVPTRQHPAPTARTPASAPATAERTPASTPAAAPTPSAPPDLGPRRRRTALLVLAIIAVLAIVAGLGAFLLGNGPSGDTTQRSAQPSTGTERTGGAGASQEADRGGRAPESSADPSGSASREAFVEDYYAVLPDDTETGWSLLSPGFQREVGSYEDYDGFWSTIDSVTVEDVRAVGGGAVDTTLVYTTDGSSQSEVRRIELSRSGDDYLISGDAVVG